MSCPSLLFDALRRIAGDRPFTWVTDHEGFLPISYSSIVLDGVDLMMQLPSFDAEDIARLVANGLLIEIEEHRTSSTVSRVLQVARS